jgi:hypothetical protein
MMSDIVEGLGTAVEGGLFAKAVSGGAGKPTPLERGHFAEGSCLNCGTALIGAHCHACGQQAHLHRTLGAFMHDLLHGALHFDGKTWRTLPLLIAKPGELTRRYIDGERKRFVSPMALFLFSIFLMFAVFQIAGISAPTDMAGDADTQLNELASEKETALLERREVLSDRIDDPEISDTRRDRARESLADVERQLDALVMARKELPFLADTTDRQPATAAPSGIATAAAADTPATDAPEVVAGDEANLLELEEWETGLEQISWVEAAVKKWRMNPGLMLYKLQTNFYKFSWLLIPLSIPFVWVLFAWKRRFRAYDHAIFVTYSLSFMTLLTLGVVLAGLAGAATGAVAMVSVFVPPIHIYKHLRGTYGLSRFSALWRLSVLIGAIVVILGLFTALLALLGLY